MSTPAADVLYWVKVEGLKPELTKDDIAAYFQSARCGSGVVRTLVYVGQYKAAAILGIEGMDSNGAEKLAKGSHNISGVKLRVVEGQQPSQLQMQHAINFPPVAIHSTSSKVMQPPLHVQPQVTQSLRPAPVPRPRTKNLTSSLTTGETSVSSAATEGLFVASNDIGHSVSHTEDFIERIRPESVPVESDAGSTTMLAIVPSNTTPTTPLHSASIASDSKTPLSPVVKVVGILPEWDEEMLAMAFDDEDEGGGEIEENGIQIKGNEALITFKDPEVAQQVVLKEVWEISDVQVHLLPFQRKLDAAQGLVDKCSPKNTIVIDDIPEGVATGHLLNYLENITKLDEGDDFTLHHKGVKALMVLQAEPAGNLEASVTCIQTPKRMLEGCRLKAARLTPIQSVLLSSVRNDMCREDKLKVYFKNKKRSGGGKVQEVQVIAKGQAIVTFQDTEGVDGVLARSHAGNLGEEVDLQTYHPVLTLWSGTVAPIMRAKSEQKSAVYHKLSRAWYEHIQRCELVQVVNDRLTDMKLSAQAKMDAPQTAVCIEPTAGSEYDEEWSSLCSDILREVLGTVSEASVKIPEDVAGKVFPVILANTRHPNVSITLSQSQDHVQIIGSQQDTEQLSATVQSIISNNLDTMKEVTLPVSILEYADKCIRPKLERDNPQVIFKVSLPNGNMHISGKDAGCDSFLAQVRKLQPTEMVPLLDVKAVQLLSMPNGKQLLHSKLPNDVEPVSYYFTAADGSIPNDDITLVQALHIVGSTTHNVQNAVDALQRCIVVVCKEVPKEFKNTLRLETWAEMKRSTEKQYVALLIPDIERQQIQFVCDTNSVDLIQREIQSFIERECFAEVCIPLERGQWVYMCEHSKEWNRESVRIEDTGMEYKFPSDEDQVLAFKLAGETTPVKKHATAIRAILGNIVKKKMEVARPGTVKHFQSNKGTLELKGIGAEYKAVVEITTLEEEEEEAVLMEQVAQPTHRTVCSGFIAGNKKVEIMVGDLTDYPVDGIVNPANEKLQHGGGLAGLIARKGGNIIQDESTRYVGRHGPLDVGETVLMKGVGNLPCKAILHTVGPKWKEGKHKAEGYLAKAAEGCLGLAQKHKLNSIGFPAISSGIYGVPLDVCARAMYTGMSNFFLKNPQCNIKIVIMLFRDNHADLFNKEVDRFLQNVSWPQTTTSPVSTETPQVPVEEAFPESDMPSPPTWPKRPVISKLTPQKTSDGTQLRIGPKQLVLSQMTPLKISNAIVLQKGSLTDHQADVYVNTAASNLDLRYGGVANSLRTAGGPKLQEECAMHTQVNGNVKTWEFATSGGHQLKCKHVIHTVGANYDGPGGLAEKGMRTMIWKVMEECDQLKASSVAFPALGAGNLDFPERVVADIMVNTISTYLDQQKGKTTLKSVILVIFLDKTHKAFKKVMKRGVVTPHLPTCARQQLQPPPGAAPDDEEYDIVSEEFLALQQDESTVFRCNNVTIDIVHGDISEDNCEGLVNTAGESLILQNFGVQRALLQKGGQALQDECTAAAKQYGKLSHGKVIVTGPGRPGGLKCRKILHIHPPPMPGGLIKTVAAALQRADKEGLKSVALPAIGTGQHNFTAKEAAKSICEAIVSFSKSNQTTLCHIRIILFEKNLFSEFTQHFEESGKEKGLIRSILGAVGGFFSAVTSAFSTNDPASQQVFDSWRDTDPTVTVGGASHPPGPLKRVRSYSESSVLVISVYAGSQQIALDVIAHIGRIIEETIVNEEVVEELINDLPTAVEQDLQDTARQLHVKLTIDRGPLHTIKVRGSNYDVAKIKTAIMASLHDLRLKMKRDKEAELLSVNVKWQWKDSQGEFQNYEPMVNLKIENAYSNGNASVSVDTEDGHKVVDIRKMTESSQLTPSVTEVRRWDLKKEMQDLEREKKEGERPSSWDPMPTDPSTGKEVVCHVVQLDASSPEYKEVEQAFSRSLGDVGTFHTSMSLPYQGIIKIERIQNQKLYSQYIARKRYIDKSNPDGHQNEQRLFHGCSSEVTDAINHEGLNRNYAGKHATKYGRGVYFAKEAYYSARDLYNPRDGNGHKRMYYAQVLTGQYAQGKEEMLVPPPKDPKGSVLHDSVVDDMAEPFIFVVFQDAHVYPEYLITFH